MLLLLLPTSLQVRRVDNFKQHFRCDVVVPVFGKALFSEGAECNERYALQPLPPLCQTVALVNHVQHYWEFEIVSTSRTVRALQARTLSQHEQRHHGGNLTALDVKCVALGFTHCNYVQSNETVLGVF